MIITKVLSTSIDLLDPNDIYSADIDRVLLKKLSTRYENKCFQSMLITSILRIIDRSSIRMVENRIDGGAYVDVKFEVSGIVFAQGEVLHGCKIVEIQGHAITAEHKHAGIKLQKEVGGHITKVLSPGQIIPIVIQKARYTPNQPMITVAATPYTPPVVMDVYYTITEGLDDSDIQKLQIIFADIMAEEEKHTVIKTAKTYGFFQDILYPYRSAQKYEHSKVCSTLGLKPLGLDIKSMSSISTGLIVAPAADSKINKRVFWNKDVKQVELDPAMTLSVTSRLYPVISDIAIKYLLYMQSLRGFVETYNTDVAVKDLITYWKICKSYQIA